MNVGQYARLHFKCPGVLFNMKIENVDDHLFLSLEGLPCSMGGRGGWCLKKI
jgi:hypothetical protein